MDASLSLSTVYPMPSRIFEHVRTAGHIRHSCNDRHILSNRYNRFDLPRRFVAYGALPTFGGLLGLSFDPSFSNDVMGGKAFMRRHTSNHKGTWSNKTQPWACTP